MDKKTGKKKGVPQFASSGEEGLKERDATLLHGSLAKVTRSLRTR